MGNEFNKRWPLRPYDPLRPSLGLAPLGQLSFDSPRYRSYFLREVVGLMSSIVMMISRETQLLSARLQLCRLFAA